MGTGNVTRMIWRAYGKRYGLRDYGLVRGGEALPWVTALTRRIHPVAVALRGRWLLLTLIGTAIVLAGGALYYYNVLVKSGQDVLAARGKVEALMQRRNDISINLSKAVLDYSRHERGVLTAVVAIRSMVEEGEKRRLATENGAAGTLPGPPAENGKTGGGAGRESASGGAVPSALPAELGGLAALMARPEAAALSGGADGLSGLNRLLAVAEQYPDLKLSVTFQSLMAALVEVEKDLAAERINYNDKVNVYTTNLMMFPLNICAYLFGFEPEPYFRAEPEARKLVPIPY